MIRGPTAHRATPGPPRVYSGFSLGSAQARAGGRAGDESRHKSFTSRSPHVLEPPRPRPLGLSTRLPWTRPSPPRLGLVLVFDTKPYIGRELRPDKFKKKGRCVGAQPSSHTAY